MLLLGKNTARDTIIMTWETRSELPVYGKVKFSNTCTNTRLLGPCFQTGRIRINKSIYTSPWLARIINYILIQSINWMSLSQRNVYQFDSLSINMFAYCLTLSPKFFSSFPHGTCTLMVFLQWWAVCEYHHTLQALVPKNTTQEFSWCLLLTS